MGLSSSVYIDNTFENELAYKHISSNTKKVIFRERFTEKPITKTLKFPDTVRELELDIDYSLDFVQLPKNLEKLTLFVNNMEEIHNYKLPKNLRKAIFFSRKSFLVLEDGRLVPLNDENTEKVYSGL